jgi:hypothetical protein
MNGDTDKGARMQNRRRLMDLKMAEGRLWTRNSKEKLDAREVLK